MEWRGARGEGDVARVGEGDIPRVGEARRGKRGGCAIVAGT